MFRRSLTLLLTAILMLTGFILPALRVTACLTANAGMPAGCPMKAAKPIREQTPDKHGCCIKKASNPETKVITAACCCKIKAAAKPVLRDYRTGCNIGDVAIAFEHRLTLTCPAVLAAPNAKRILLDERISRGPPNGTSPLRGPPSNS